MAPSGQVAANLGYPDHKGAHMHLTCFQVNDQHIKVHMCA